MFTSSHTSMQHGMKKSFDRESVLMTKGSAQLVSGYIPEAREYPV
jgi:hypothetical protein